MDYTVHDILQARLLEWIAFLCSKGSSDPGIEPGSPALQGDSSLAVIPANSIYKDKVDIVLKN